MIQSIHPFPARMAPELALEGLRSLQERSIVLDPMAGSGTVLRQASELGHTAIGFDMDPLAVLMSRVWTKSVKDTDIQQVYEVVIQKALALDPLDASLPWIDNDAETLGFVRYWFAPNQLKQLRCLAFVLHQLENEDFSDTTRSATDVLRIALSRIIITKEQCASLARDTSHSRPHRVATNSEYAVFSGFKRSLDIVRKRLIDAPPKGNANVAIGDARSTGLANCSVDAVLTSPPYLNAIDYMRGHRLSLVWLDYGLANLRMIRSKSEGLSLA